MTISRWIATVIAGWGLLLAAPVAVHAQSAGAKDAYVKVIENAVSEFEHGNWAESRVLFEQAHALRPSARTLRGMGMVSFELKEYLRAEMELNAALHELRLPLSEAQRREALALLLRLENFIGKLKVSVRPQTAKASIILDGSPVEGELKLDLGPHELSIHAAGYRPLTRMVQIEGGKTVRLDLTLTPVDLALQPQQPGITAEQAAQPSAAASQPVPVDASHHQPGLLERWWFWAIVGAVVAGGVVTTVALTSTSSTEPPLPGNTGVTAQVLTWQH